MASVTDIGGLGDPGTDPPLGGEDGWAAAVRDVLGASDTPVNSRIAAAVAGLEQEAHASEHSAAGGDPVSISPSQVVGTAVVDGDARLSDPRTPVGHASSHGRLGTDTIQLTSLGASGSTTGQVPVADGSGGIAWGTVASGGGGGGSIPVGGSTGQALAKNSAADGDVEWASFAGLWTGTQAAYDALGTHDAGTLYVVVG